MARGHFAQVMQREHHHRCYRKWQETFQVEQLYQEVSEEVREMHDYLLMQRTEDLKKIAETEAKAEADREQAEQKRDQKLNKLIFFISVLFCFPSLVMAFLGTNIEGYTNSEGVSGLFAIILIACSFMPGLALWLGYSIIRRKTDKKSIR
jgi:cation transport ATPase